METPISRDEEKVVGASTEMVEDCANTEAADLYGNLGEAEKNGYVTRG